MSQAYESIVKNSYKNHVATVKEYWHLDKDRKESKDEIKVLIWKAPDTYNYYIKYIIHGNTLFVTGDLGEATYCWSDFIDFEWLATIDMTYFASKCQASEVGRPFQDWDAGVAMKTLKEMAENEYFDWKEFEERFGEDELQSQDSWAWWVDHNADYVMKSQDYWEWAYSVGSCTHIRCYFHFIGLQMAVAQLKEKEKADVAKD